ncbi:MAG: FAD-dependent oxidoreductase [Verrucomicrobiota bacterium]
MIAFLNSGLAGSGPDSTRADVCVYGSTSGAITAAVQTARMGKTVILLSPTNHLGGMSTSGLGFTDFGSEEALGGLSREFYHRLYLHYQDVSAWVWQKRGDFKDKGQGAPAFIADKELATVFEPAVAEKVFGEMLKEAGVRVLIGRLDRDKGVRKEGNRITSVCLEDGTDLSARMFIDATYEGDLLAGVGVSYTIGREPNSTYGETVNGIQAQHSKKNQLPDGISPYVVKDDPASGLLPHVNPSAGGADGFGDKRLQSYCYRMVLTDVPENRIPVEKPDSYNERDYEILFRCIEAGQSHFFKLSMMPNRKTDSNNSAGLSCDAIGANYGDDWNYAEAGYAKRAEVERMHESWQRGLIWTLQHHPRIPQAIRDFYANWGLPKDEFSDNRNWAYDIYVREGRRMVSDYVMTEHNCSGKVIADDSIGMGAYTMDSHHTQRYVTESGMLKNEGDIQKHIPKPYPIAYRAIVPKANECSNLLVPWALSASHMAFGSIRMEPVFMGLGQSAATAACLAIDEGTSVQDVAYPKLRDRLLKDGVILSLGNPDSN